MKITRRASVGALLLAAAAVVALGAFQPSPAESVRPPSSLVFVKNNQLWRWRPSEPEPRVIEAQEWISPSSPVIVDPLADTILFAAHKRQRYGAGRDGINIRVADVLLATPTGLSAVTDQNDLALAPDIRRDGRIVFTSNRHARLRALMPQSGSMEIYVVKSPWRIAERVTEDGGWKFNPRWSPDGSMLAWLQVQGDSSGLYVAPVDRPAAARRIAAAGDYPSWRPDGKAIAYVHQGVIREIELSTGATRILLRDFDGHASFLRWTPRGLLFQFSRPGTQGIALFDPSSRRVRTLLESADIYGAADLAP